MLRGLRVKFVGDIQIAVRFFGEIAGACKKLDPHRRGCFLLSIEDVTHTRPTRRLRVATRWSAHKGYCASPNGIDPAIIHGTAVEANVLADAGDTPRRRSGAGGTSCHWLKDVGFCAIGRSARFAMPWAGRAIHKSNEISPTLVSLTQQEVLQRERTSRTVGLPRPIARWMKLARSS